MPTVNILSEQTCAHCGTRNTTMWRRDSSGQYVCNACGLYFRMNGQMRPAIMRKETIRRRKRRAKPMVMLQAMLGPDFFVNKSAAEPDNSQSIDDGLNVAESSLERLLKHEPSILPANELGKTLKKHKKAKVNKVEQLQNEQLFYASNENSSPTGNEFQETPYYLYQFNGNRAINQDSSEVDVELESANTNSLFDGVHH